MDTNFICACCGEHTMFTKEKAEAIIRVICDYYGLLRSEVFKKSRSYNHIRSKEDEAELLSIFFIRKFTAASLKVIASHVNSNETHVSHATRKSIYSNQSYAKAAEEIEDRIVIHFRYQEGLRSTKGHIRTKNISGVLPKHFKHFAFVHILFHN